MKKVIALLLVFTIANLKLNLKASSAVIYGPSVIHKQVDSILTMSDILALYQSELGPVTVSIDEYTGNGNVISSYALQLFATDGTSIATKNVVIYVINNLGKVKAVTDYKNIHMTLTQAQEMTLAEIPRIVSRTGYFTLITGAQMAIISDTFTAGKTTPGMYQFEFRIVDQTGYDETFLSNVYVYDSSSMIDPDIVYGNPPSSLDGFAKGLQNLWWFVGFGIGIGLIWKLSKSKKVIQ